MNSVNLIGRLVKDPVVRANGDTKFADMTIAIDRVVGKGKEKKTDFPRIKCAGFSAEFAEKYLKKGKLIGVTGSIQTDSYKGKDGQMVYTTDVFASRVELLEWEKKDNADGQEEPPEMPSGFQAIADEDIPF